MAKRRFRRKVTPAKTVQWPRVLVGLPMERTVPATCFWDKMKLYHRSKSQGAVWIEDNEYALRVDVIRNKMAMKLLASDATHLLMVDLDHYHPADLFERMVAHVVEDPGRLVVAGWNFRRGQPYDPVVQFYGDNGELYSPREWDDGLIQIARDESFPGGTVGTGSILIAREVFERIEPPWFTYDYSKWEFDSWPGEDITFSKRCLDAGIALYADTTIVSPHLDSYFIDRGTFEAFKRRVQVREEEILARYADSKAIEEMAAADEVSG